MRILSLNLRSGGSRRTLRALVARCMSHGPDVVTFSEFRNNAAGQALRDQLRASAFTCHAGSLEYPRNGVMVASHLTFTSVNNPFGLSDDDYPNAVVEARFGRLRAYAVYLPGQDRKRPHLRCFIAAAIGWSEHGIPAIAIGDFNSGRNATDIEINLGRSRLRDEFSTADLYEELERHAIEAWIYTHPKQVEFSWYPFRTDRRAVQRNGWRIDKAFVSPALLPMVRRAEYDHGFRAEGLTDHSALIVDLDVGQAGTGCGTSEVDSRAKSAF